MTHKRLAVVSDATSSGAFFGIWHKYYSKLCGAENLFVITYEGKSREFDGFGMGGLIELPCKYDDNLRARFIGKYITTLLTYYDAIIRVDTDEFITTRGGASLVDYLSSSNRPYITAKGFDLIAGDQEKALDLSSPILIKQRKFAYGNTALNKIAYTKVEVKWAPGFHYSSLAPLFGDIYLFHLKFADLELQLKWRGVMSEAISIETEDYERMKNYYKPDFDRLMNYRSGILKRPLVYGYSGLDDVTEIGKFLMSINFDSVRQIYTTPHVHHANLVELPEDLSAAF